MASVCEGSLDHSLSGELTCPVCLEIFQNPLKLPCEHDLCRHCIEDLLRTSGGREFDCPECREHVDVGDGGIEALRRNVRLKNIIDNLRRKSAEKKIRPRSHRVAIRPVRQRSRDDNAELLSNIYDERKKTLSGEIEVLTNKNDELEIKIKRLREEIIHIEDKCRKSKDLLDAKCESLIAIIKERQSLMTEKMHQEKRQIIGTLEEKVGKLQERVDHGIAVVMHAEDTMGAIDSATFLKQYKEVKESVSAATNDINESLEEEQNRPPTQELQYDLNFDHVTTVMKSLHLQGRGCHGSRHNYGPPARVEHARYPGIGGYSKMSFSFDPETAHRDLKLTNKNMTVKWDALGANDRMVTNSPRRFIGAMNPCVLGDTEIYGGICYWEALVNNCLQYRVGVISDPNMNRWEQIGTNQSSWCLRCNHGCYEVMHKAIENGIRVFDVPVRIGVYLDLKNGVLAFYDPDRKRLLHKWFDLPLGRGSVTPAFYIGKDGSMTIKTGLDVPVYCRDE